MCSDETEMYGRVMRYAKTLKVAAEVLGTKIVRYETDLAHVMLPETVSLLEFCSGHKREAGVIAILSTHTMPQVNPAEKFVYDYKSTIVSVDINGELCYSEGLAAAYIYNVPSVGFASEEYWDEVMHKICVESDGAETDDTDWPCLTALEHLTKDDFNQWVQEHSELELIETTLAPGQKSIHLEKHHGYDVLLEHAKALCRNEYVEGVLTSLQWRGGFRDYIFDIRADGCIDIVLFWEEEGFSMRVKTTGRNIQETKAIATILKDKYSK